MQYQSEEHKPLLDQHHIDVSEKDAIEAGPYGNLNISANNVMIDEVIVHVKEIFEEIRRTQKIPLYHIRKRIVPIILHMIEQPAILDLFVTLHRRDDYLYSHSLAVGVISALLGKWLAIQNSELLQLTTAAIIHDVGKVMIPASIINKPGELTAEEYEVMKRHTILGYELIKDTIGTNHNQALVALQHHERMDGLGYPLGINADRIGLFSRIVAIADVFHAMSSKQVYRHALPFYEVLSQMEQYAYGKLDTGIVRLFLKKIMQSILGYNVLLTDGRKGKVIYINPNCPTLPLVHIGDEFVDLSNNTDIKIEQMIIDE